MEVQNGITTKRYVGQFGKALVWCCKCEEWCDVDEMLSNAHSLIGYFNGHMRLVCLASGSVIAGGPDTVTKLIYISKPDESTLKKSTSVLTEAE